MSAASQLALDGLSDGVTVYCYGYDGCLLDVIEDVSLGDRIEAAGQGRESLHTACLWGYVAAKARERTQPHTSPLTPVQE